MTASRLTTFDNPYDPFSQFTEWFAEDIRLGYDTTGYLARIVRNSEELSDADNDEAIEVAIDEIIKEHNGGIYKKIAPPSS